MNEQTDRRFTMIVAASENNVIGASGDLPWRLSADLQRFKRLTMSHSIIMGRKTFDSIGRLLPGRTTIIVTRNLDYTFEGATIVHSLEEALAACASDEQPFLVGGAEMYRLGLPLVEEIQMTRVHVELDGDTFLPEIDWSEWELVSDQRHPADPKNDFDYSFQRYLKRATDN
ncbi:MAG: dihydrofolate reductase [Planctomycetota bacterium]